MITTAISPEIPSRLPTIPEAPANGLRAAINGKCRDCIHDQQAPGTWRQQTEGCTIKSCTLWPYRPKSKTKPNDPEEAIGDLTQGTH